METSEALLSEFNDQLSLAEKYQGYISKAQEFAERFSPAVVEKVVTENTTKLGEVVDAVAPLRAGLTERVGLLQAEAESAVAGGDSSRLELEELELRQAIGELDDEAFESKSSELKGNLDSIETNVASLNAERDQLQEALGRWKAFAEGAGLDLPQDDPEPEASEADLELDDALDLDDDLGLDDDFALESDDDEVDFGDLEGFEEDEESGVHSSKIEISDDVSVVFEDEDSDAGDSAAGLSFGDVELDDNLSLELPPSDSEPEEAASGDGRDAALVYNEGKDDEKVYALEGDVMSLGRGRDNVVQVKNDSKVSRHHCSVVARDSAFYLEDKGSANGTLVNGEHVTERRLFGGEEIIIGETFFRFRIGE